MGAGVIHHGKSEDFQKENLDISKLRDCRVWIEP